MTTNISKQEEHLCVAFVRFPGIEAENLDGGDGVADDPHPWAKVTHVLPPRLGHPRPEFAAVLRGFPHNYLRE